MRVQTTTFLACLMASSSACVTVNVNFPESAVQKATDDYVRDLYRAKEKGKSAQPSTGLHAPSFPPVTFHIPNFGNLILPSAMAADDGMFKVASPKASEIKGRLANRLDEVLAQKRTGVLGETNDGFLTLKAPDKVSKLLIKKIEGLVSAENTDRKELYAEVLRLNGLEKSRMDSIQHSFARSFQAESPSGTWVQDSDGKWSQKP